MSKSNKNIIVLLRVPFIDKIPSLKSLIVYLSSCGHHITIISSYTEEYPTLDYKSDHIDIKLVKERKRFFEVPTSIKLIFYCILSYFRLKPQWFIGGDSVVSYLLYSLSRFFPIKYIDFLLEFPSLNNKNDEKSLNNAAYIITHDKWHREFIQEHFNIDTDKILLLPNSTYTPVYKEDSYYLQKLFNTNKKIILHSGGLGEWFCCKELAKTTEKWEDDTVLVFHTSHKVEETVY